VHFQYNVNQPIPEAGFWIFSGYPQDVTMKDKKKIMEDKKNR